jgi:hypothetical protein
MKTTNVKIQMHACKLTAVTEPGILGCGGNRVKLNTHKK